MRALMLPVALAALTLVAGCETLPTVAPTPEPTYSQAQGDTFTNANYTAVSELLRRYPPSSTASATNTGPASSAPFLVSTLVNIDQLEQSSTFGRLISEQITTRLSQLGHGVVELKLRNGVFMKRNEGEFLLTREIKEVASAHRAQAVIVGTYAESNNLIYVSLKVINPTNSLILAAYDYALPLDKQVRSLIGRTRTY